MKLLMITRRVDKDDGLAGFTYNWINKLSSRVDKLEVICLEKGNSSGLPANVAIYSLGKEKGKNRLREFWRFQQLARHLVPTVDGVFSHQNPEYGILVSPWTKIFRKKLVAWYVHRQVSWRLKLLNLLVYKMISINEASFRLKSKKVVFLHHGIDTDIFVLKSREEHDELRILSVSRISQTKQIDKMIDLVADLKNKINKKIILKIVGEPALEKDIIYLSSLKEQVLKLGLSENIEFLGAVPNFKTPELYQWSDVFLNFSQTGSVDKTVLEAMSCGTPVLVSNEAFKDILRPINDLFFIAEIKYAAENILEILSINNYELKKTLNEYIKNNHSLDSLVKEIVKLF